jgi:NAD-dependent DNA ligase
MYDDDGQPLCEAWMLQRRIDSAVDEVLGLARGIVADGEVSPREVDVLVEWTVRHSHAAHKWPVNVLVDRLARIHADGIVTDEERAELKDLLDDLIGKHEPLVKPVTALPLCKPAPEVVFDQNVFVFTGKFAYGTRPTCERETAIRGGTCKGDVTLQTAYLVVGSVGSRDWAHSSFGRKIQKAAEYRALAPVSIISERHWASYLLPAVNP